MRMTFLTALLSSSALCRPYGYDGTALAASYTAEADIPEAAKAFYAKAGERWELNVEITGVTGVKKFTDFSNLAESLRKERSDHRKLREQIRTNFGDKPIDELFDTIRSDLDRIPELEAAADTSGDPKKVEKLVEAKLAAKLAPVERERDQLRTTLAEKDKAIADFSGKEKTRKVHDHVREAAVKLKLLPEALDDALLLADRVFEANDDGTITVKDGVGFGVGNDGAGWLTEMQTKRPHWWAPSTGNGSGGNRTPGGGANNPWSNDHWNMTLQGQQHRADPIMAANLAKAAGTTIGGPRPIPKK